MQSSSIFTYGSCTFTGVFSTKTVKCMCVEGDIPKRTELLVGKEDKTSGLCWGSQEPGREHFAQEQLISGSTRMEQGWCFVLFESLKAVPNRLSSECNMVLKKEMQWTEGG